MTANIIEYYQKLSRDGEDECSCDLKPREWTIIVIGRYFHWGVVFVQFVCQDSAVIKWGDYWHKTAPNSLQQCLDEVIDSASLMFVGLRKRPKLDE